MKKTKTVAAVINGRGDYELLLFPSLHFSLFFVFQIS